MNEQKQEPAALPGAKRVTRSESETICINDCSLDKCYGIALSDGRKAFVLAVDVSKPGDDDCENRFYVIGDLTLAVFCEEFTSFKALFNHQIDRGRSVWQFATETDLFRWLSE